MSLKLSLYSHEQKTRTSLRYYLPWLSSCPLCLGVFKQSSRGSRKKQVGRSTTYFKEIKTLFWKWGGTSLPTFFFWPFLLLYLKAGQQRRDHRGQQGRRNNEWAKGPASSATANIIIAGLEEDDIMIQWRRGIKNFILRRPLSGPALWTFK